MKAGPAAVEDINTAPPETSAVFDEKVTFDVPKETSKAPSKARPPPLPLHELLINVVGPFISRVDPASESLVYEFGS